MVLNLVGNAQPSGVVEPRPAELTVEELVEARRYM